MSTCGGAALSSGEYTALLRSKPLVCGGYFPVAGPTGATGATGAAAPSAFYGSPTLSTLITTTGVPGTQVGSTTTITTTTTGYIWATATVNLKNDDNSSDHIVGLYMIVNGTQSSASVDLLSKASGGISTTTANLTVHQRTTSTVPAGTYNVQVFAYTDATGVAGNHIRCDHVDVFALGNLG